MLVNQKQDPFLNFFPNYTFLFLKNLEKPHMLHFVNIFRANKKREAKFTTVENNCYQPANLIQFNAIQFKQNIILC